MQLSRSWISIVPGTHSKAETNVETLEYEVEEYRFSRSKVNIDALKHIIQMLVDKRSKNRR